MPCWRTFIREHHVYIEVLGSIRCIYVPELYIFTNEIIDRKLIYAYAFGTKV